MVSQSKIFLASVGVILSVLFLNYIFFSPPLGFAKESIFSVEEGMSLRSVSRKLKDENFIRSRMLFEAFVIAYAGERHAVATDYFFEKKLPVQEIARRIATGKSALAPIRFTVPEGFTNNEIADTARLKFPNFDKDEFLALAKDKQ